jgi:cytochrome c peroxidase
MSPLDPVVLLGKRIFYHAGDPRMSAEGYLSCATCHLDGGDDGRSVGLHRPRRGPAQHHGARTAAPALAHGRVHWSANFDEIQDFENDIRGAFGGTAS